ncbi:DapH/DapD/GlmU-related protein [uncultured Psychroserpens sp.]|uniref:acyltransferase n=1 Tax=uncultured Psychroserpens sp. TaxID=255436 RepID=UPI00260C0DF9|nr:acyltransferase [uncultured Psychroserpens sp.]
MIIYKIASKINNRISTAFFLLKYFILIKKKGKITIGYHVKLIPFWWEKTKLKVVFEANSRIKSNVIIQGSGTLTLGENSYISSFSVIGVNDRVTIGKNVMIADSVSIRDTDHNFSDLNKNIIEQGKSTQPITIHDNVWIGHGVVITKGVTIQSGAIVAANAVVTNDVEKNTIVGGVPARILKLRDDK